MILTGNFVANLFMTVGFFLFMPVTKQVLDRFKNIFWMNYIDIESDLSYMTYSNSLLEIHIPDNIWEWISILLFIAGTFVLTSYLFEKRPAEGAGKSVIFPVVELISKSICVVLMSGLCAIFFYEAVQNKGRIWFAFGGAIGFILTNCVLEILFRSNFREVFANKWHWILNLCLVLLAFVIFRYDLVGYNERIPSQTEVESVSIYTDCMDEMVDYLVYNDRYGVEESESMSKRKNILKKMKLQNEETKKAVYNLIQKSNEITKKQTLFGTDWVSEKCEVDYSVVEFDDFETLLQYLQSGGKKAEEGLHTITIGFEKKYGKMIYRKYYMDLSDTETLNDLAVIYEDSDYKQVMYPLLSYSVQGEEKIDLYVMGIFGYYNER